MKDKTPEFFLRKAFGEIEIAKEDSKYPPSTQRPSIYRAMEAYSENNILLLQEARIVIMDLLNVANEDEFQSIKACKKAIDFINKTRILVK